MTDSHVPETTDEFLPEVVRLLDRLASLVENISSTTPDDRDRVAARQLAIDAGELAKSLGVWDHWGRAT